MRYFLHVTVYSVYKLQFNTFINHKTAEIFIWLAEFLTTIFHFSHHKWPFYCIICMARVKGITLMPCHCLVMLLM